MLSGRTLDFSYLILGVQVHALLLGMYRVCFPAAFLPPLKPGPHPRVAVALLLQGQYGQAMTLLAIVCSSWSVVNLATSQRDVLVPRGNQSLLHVRRGNLMTARTGCVQLQQNV